ncbi:MAG: hypothetical protein V4603_04620 [Pseudomonadota bacterium]
MTTLMVVMLLGGQLLQHSPWHDHATETVDCALCHLQSLGDDTELDHSLPAAIKQASNLIAHNRRISPVADYPSPYQGRAPPLTSV